MDFGKWLDKQIEKRDWTQAQLARKAGVSRTAIADVISGRRKAGPELCRSIAVALGVPPEEVYRQAGLLPEKPPRSKLLEALEYLIDHLPEERQQAVLEYAEFQLQQAKQEDRAAGYRNLAKPKQA